MFGSKVTPKKLTARSELMSYWWMYFAISTSSGSNSRFTGEETGALLFEAVVENEAAIFGCCVRTCLVKLEAIGLATEAVRSVFEADLDERRRELLIADMVKLMASSSLQENEKWINWRRVYNVYAPIDIIFKEQQAEDLSFVYENPSGQSFAVVQSEASLG
jgi:hypothetical protein